MSANACGLMQNDLFGAEPEPFRPPREKSFEPVPDSKEMVRVAPNVWAWRPSNPDRVPRYGRHMWVKNPDGTYRPAPQESRFVIVSREVLDEIGFKGMSRSVSDTTLRRLAEAQEILMFHVSPRVRMLDLDSWWRYVDECITDPYQWDEGSESHRNYMFRNALGAHRRKTEAGAKEGE